MVRGVAQAANHRLHKLPLAFRERSVKVPTSGVQSRPTAEAAAALMSKRASLIHDRVLGALFSAFAVHFEPVDHTRTLYRGTVWIDRATFVRLKARAVQANMTGAIVSNDETQEFAPCGEIGGVPIWLLGHLTSKQIFLIAGRSVLVERELRLSDVVLNPPGFEEDRATSRGSDRIMYRDTDRGVRYLVKKGDARVVSDRLTQSARAFALGMQIDPSYDWPIPIGGLNILDFNFLDRDMQLALLFGGVVAFGNIQRADLWGGRFDASLDVFGIAIKSNDDVYGPEGKKDGERVNRIPAGTGFNLGFQLTPFQRVTGHFEIRYDAYFRDAATNPDFVIPSSTATLGEGAGYEYRRRGYSLVANLSSYQRARWDAWGQGDSSDPDERTFTRFDAGLSKDFTFNTFHTVHLSGTYFGGRRLDRFSRYQFGMFDATRMHGVPSSVRFGELAMFRGSYSFNLFEQYRADLFVEQAAGRDQPGGSGWMPVTGMGVRLSLRAPRSTILQIDFGKSLLPNTYHGLGSTTLLVMLLKPLS